MSVDFTVCPKCNSSSVTHGLIEDIESEGADISADCDECGAIITFSLKVIDAEYKGQYDEDQI